MKKLDEHENEPRVAHLSRAPALAVQFFLIPLAVVGVVALFYGGFRMLITTERTPDEYLSDIRTGGRERRWPAAYELSRLLSDPNTEVDHPEVGSSIVRAFSDSTGGDPRVRQYLALAIGRLNRPPADAVSELVAALGSVETETQISVIWALASLGEISAATHIAALYRSDDAGVRKMVIYALGALPGGGHIGTLRNGLDDPIVDVQWNAAVALARHGQNDGVSILRRMLDREYVERMVTRSGAPNSGLDPVSEVIVSGLQAVSALREVGLREEVRGLSEADSSLSVRDVALRALEVLPETGSDSVEINEGRTN